MSIGKKDLDKSANTKEYQRLISEHMQNQEHTLITTKRADIAKQVQTNEDIQQQQSLALKVLPFVMAVFAGVLLFFGLFLPEQLVYGTLLTPLVLVLVLKITANPKKVKSLTKTTVKTVAETTLHPTNLFTTAPSSFASLIYLAKILIALFATNLVLWFTGGFLYQNFLRFHISGPNCQNLFVFIMALTSTIMLIKLKPRKPTKRFLYLLLYAVKITFFVVFIDLTVWTVGLLLHTLLFSSFSLEIFQISLYVCVATTTSLILLAKLIRKANTILTIILLTCNTLLCVLLYALEVTLFLPLFIVLILFYCIFTATILKTGKQGDKIKWNKKTKQ